MVVIRLARHGAKKSPFYHITVADKRARRDGRFVDGVWASSTPWLGARPSACASTSNASITGWPRVPRPANAWPRC